MDFNQSAEAVCRAIHGLTPWPGCRVQWHCQATGKTQTLILRRAEALPNVPPFVRKQFEAAAPPEPGTVLEGMLVVANPGVVKLVEVQGPGTRPMKAQAFARGHHLGEGDTLEKLPGA